MRFVTKIIFRTAAGPVALLTVQVQALAAADLKSVDFNRDIRPILSENCFACHGPDEQARKAKLRLDRPADAFKPLESGGAAVVPGDPARSKLVQRITTGSEEDRMPPPKTGKTLTLSQIELLRQWIGQGAKYQAHWAFIRPLSPPLPKVQNANWPKNGIDHFILARLETEKLQPPPEADKTTLLRRVSLDLTGLPPTPRQVSAFLADDSVEAYEKVVDRLLASPRYGERMAIRWLDAARYADTSGYQTDGERHMWRWRDWVIDAFNHNLPFDQFTIEQIAGDMLPGATLDQKIATGFNRNHRGNSEGGIIPEEYAVEYVVDRVDTTCTVWLGLTMGCARCHDHKFDPFTQREYYQLFTYFNNVPEKGRAIKTGNSPPFLAAPTLQQQKELKSLEENLAAAEEGVRKMEPALAAAQSEWESRLRTNRVVATGGSLQSSSASANDPGGADAPDLEMLYRWTIADGLKAMYEFDGKITNAAELKKRAAFTNGEPSYVTGKIGQAAEFDGARFIDAGDVGPFGFFDKFSCGAWIFAKNENGAILSRMPETLQADGYSLCLERGKVQVNLVRRWLDDALRVETEQPIELNRWHHVMMTYDGSRLATGLRIYVDGKPQSLKVNLDELNQSFKTSEPFRIGSGGGLTSRFRGCIDDARVYDRVLSPTEVAILATTDSIFDIVAISAAQRTSEQAAKVRAYFLQNYAPHTIRDAYQMAAKLQKQKAEFLESLPTVMVMEEMKPARDTFLLIRGQDHRPGEKVNPGVPASLSPSNAALRNRLNFAQWLVDPANPLTARVAVNQSWQMYFGEGLVKTAEDWGSRGELPSHPELLDWLATEFISGGWNVKAMQKLIVMSATYRQSSKVTTELLQRDPDNRLLARGPRLRLPAEMIRDQALALSGLLVETIGGPSVMPYQPAGLWKELSGNDYAQDKGEKLYRRSLYTFWKRTSAPPAMMAFDAAGREMCSVRQTRTSTPLQALNLMNDVTFVEAARVLAQRILTEGGRTPLERIGYLFQLATARHPRPAELEILQNNLSEQLKHYRENPKAALELIRIGEAPRDQKIEASELAGYTAIANLVLNLDETITKE